MKKVSIFELKSKSNEYSEKVANICYYIATKKPSYVVEFLLTRLGKYYGRKKRNIDAQIKQKQVF